MPDVPKGWLSAWWPFPLYCTSMHLPSSLQASRSKEFRDTLPQQNVLCPQKTFAFADLLAAMQNNIGCTFYPSSIWPPRPNRALEVYWIPHHLPCTKGKMWAFPATSLFHVLLEYGKFGFCAKPQFLTSIFSTLSSLLISLSLFIYSFQPHFFILLWPLTSLLLFLPAVNQFFSFNLLYSITIEQYGFKWYKRAKNCTRPLNVNIRIILA